MSERSKQELARLLGIMADLRDPHGGCPWDVEQTFRTIAPYTIEEAYEVADAIEREDMPELRSELGDLLFQVVFHARMAEEAGSFGFADVAQAISDKMVKRHPHVFGSEAFRTSEEQTDAWEAQKHEERAAEAEAAGHRMSVLDGVTVGMPALSRAVKLQKRAARVGFDWPEASQVLDKIREEIGELSEEIDRDSGHDRFEDELGDLLFVVANLARHLRIDPEAALRRSNLKFERRFRSIEARFADDPRPLEDIPLEELEAAWQQSKKEE